MEDDFFLDESIPKKRKGSTIKGPKSKKTKKKEEASDSEDGVNFDYSSDDKKDSSAEESSEERETAAEKRLRIAQEYLKAKEKSESNKKLNERADLSTRLQEDAVININIFM